MSLTLTNLLFYQHRLSRHCATVTVVERHDDHLRPASLAPACVRLRRSTPRLFPLCRAIGDEAHSESNHSFSSMSPDIQRPIGDKSSVDGYVGLFVRMLGLDNDPLDREQAINTLWKYSQGGKKCIDGIMQFPGCINLVVSLLKSESSSACAAAAGLLHIVSAVSMYRDAIAESGAIEEISRLLCQHTLTSEVKKQSLCTLWNLSIDEKLRERISKGYLLPIIVKFLDDEEIKVKEAAGGVIANLTLSHHLHSLLVEAGVIPKLVVLLGNDDKEYKVIHNEAEVALLELSVDEYYRIFIIEEGLVRVPLIGAAAYKSFRSPTHSWPSLPDGTKIEKTSTPSRFGASDLLVGLTICEKSINLEEATADAIVGRSRQEFLARIGAIEVDGQDQKYTLLPWVDGIARLVLILRLEDVSGITKAAYAIADASISEHMRKSFKEAGAVGLLVQLMQHNSETVREAVAHALDRLSLSNIVRKKIEEEGVLKPLTSILKEPSTSNFLLEKAVCILSRIFEADSSINMELYENITDDSDHTNNNEVVSDVRKVTDASSHEEMKREVLNDSVFISRLIEMLRTSSPSLQVKLASILEYLVILEKNVAVVMAGGIEVALDAVFRKGSTNGMENDIDNGLAQYYIETEEIGLATAAASRLLARLLDFNQCYQIIDSGHFTVLLRDILKSSIPLHTKDWIAACLVKLDSKVSNTSELGYPIEKEVVLYETIPRLVNEMSSSFSHQDQETAVKELNKIISQGVIDYTKAVATAGGIFPLVKLIEEVSGDALEASLSLLYNLSMDIENHSAIVAAGAVPVLKRIVLSEGPQWTHALRILRTLPT
ncbi:uncharacterized protein LOC121985933 isoform X1 [Zingiber officinale]|uniref:ARM repeat superfamily protein n=1 Tax=Zingiber officinale TaxID=94328 RepID=A0A8J5KZM0_ZINOF|nr:uncharacterized protein LOC121985933 isoform X1 [Zingiber officinale]XP_042395600.1 uncharacterized protein LOC121985933 isoform X1 [Zingiber officinale]KAG6505238.1 hypothetical protein ZIOFF_037592 [Zingiber officinale]